MHSGLVGVSVLVTRARDQQSELVARLESEGATVVAVPLVKIVPPPDGGDSLRSALDRIERFDWVVVTSPNGARAVCAELDARRPARGFAAIGPGTAAVLASAGIDAALVPKRSVGEGLVEAFPDLACAPRRATVLLAQAEAARRVVADGLRAKGYDVTTVVAYRSVDADVDEGQRQTARQADVVLFTSSSMVERFVRLVGIAAIPPAVGVIGPITQRTARDLAVPVDFAASEHTLDGLVEALLGWVEGSRVKE